MSRFRPALALTLLAALLAAPDAQAKKKKDKAADPPAAEAPAQESPASKATTSAAAAVPTSLQMKLQLLDAGAEPRQALRLQPAAGSEHAMQMVMDMSMDMTVGDQRQQMDTPPITMLVRSTVDGVEPDGSFRVSTVWERTEIGEGGSGPPEIAEAMRSSFQQLDGLHMTQRMGPTGRVQDARITSESSAELVSVLDSLQQNMRQSQVSLPEEPVGPGARWSITVSMVSSGVPIDATSTYTLRSIDGPVLTMDNEISMSADFKSMMANLPPGSSASIDQFGASGGGQLRWDLRELFATGDTHYKMHMAMSASAGEISMPVVMDMDYNMKIGRGK